MATSGSVFENRYTIGVEWSVVFGEISEWSGVLKFLSNIRVFGHYSGAIRYASPVKPIVSRFIDPHIMLTLAS